MPKRIKKRTTVIEEDLEAPKKRTKAELMAKVESAIGPLTPEEAEQLGFAGRSKGVKPAEKPRYRMTGNEASVRLGDRSRVAPTAADRARKGGILQGRAAGRVAGQLGQAAGAAEAGGLVESFWAAATGNEHKKMQGLVRRWLETNLPESMATERAALVDAAGKNAKKFTADVARVLKGAAGGASMKAAAVDTIMWSTVKEAIGEKTWAEKLKTDASLAGQIAAKRSSVAAVAEEVAPAVSRAGKAGAAAIKGGGGLLAGLGSVRGLGKAAAGIAAFSAAGHLIDKATGTQSKQLSEEATALQPPGMDEILAQIQQEREMAAAYTPPPPPQPERMALGARRYGVPSGTMGSGGGVAGGGATDLAALLSGSGLLD